jgi:hypothetical protein
MRRAYVTANDLIPKECAYCNKDTGNDDYNVLPNHEYEKSKWHKPCLTRFIVE